MSTCQNAVTCDCDPIFPSGSVPQPPTVYWNTPQSYTANCPSGTTGNPITVTIPENTYSSTIDQDTANNIALGVAQTDANNQLICTPVGPTTYWNVQQVATCSTGSHDNPVTYPSMGDPVTVPANQFSSIVDQSTANALALAAGQSKLNCGIAPELSGLLWEMPVTSLSVATDPADQTVSITGNQGQLYNVTALIRGVVEVKTYQSGSIIPGTDGLCWDFTGTLQSYTDPCTGYHQPSDGVTNPSNLSNEYLLIVSNPPAIYALNESQNGAVGVHPVNYSFEFQIYAGASVTLRARSIDCDAWPNHPPTSVSALPGQPQIIPSQPYPGQFLQMDITNVS